MEDIAAFLADTQLGIVTALAILAHEVPSELGDFLILLHSGYSRRQALIAANALEVDLQKLGRAVQ